MPKSGRWGCHPHTLKSSTLNDSNLLSGWVAYIRTDYRDSATNESHTPSHCGPDSIDPFALRLHPSEFYRLPDNDSEARLYFIIDNTLPILLYVGETKRTPSQRWKGVHDAKDYISNYISLHRKYKLDVAVVAAFWWDVPAASRPRQQLELALIQKW
ncbi:GIY-YIG nuclease family protein, partial [Chroococcidiopsis cubana]